MSVDIKELDKFTRDKTINYFKVNKHLTELKREAEDRYSEDAQKRMYKRRIASYLTSLILGWRLQV